MKLAYGIFYTNDLEKAKKFYQESLGLEVAFGDEKFVAFKLGDVLLGLKQSKEEREVPGHQTVIISVEDVGGLYETMSTRGLPFYKELSENSWGRNFAILDPDGNKVMFVGEK